MRIRMLQTRRGCEDGYRLRCFIAGRTYDIADGLARAFLRAGHAERAHACVTRVPVTPYQKPKKNA